MAQTIINETKASVREYEHFLLRSFFEGMVSGRLDVNEIQEKASGFGFELNAGAYTIAFVSVPPEGREGESSRDKIREAIISHFMKYPEYVLFHWDFRTLAVLIKGSPEEIDGLILRCTEKVLEHYSHFPELSWYIAVAGPVRELSELPHCFDELTDLWAQRYLSPSRHILLPGSNFLSNADSEPALANVDVEKLSQSHIIKFLQCADRSQAAPYADDYIQSFGEALNSPAFCLYLILSLRFTAAEFLLSLGIAQDELLSSLRHSVLPGRAVEPDELKLCAQDILLSALELRDMATGRNFSPLIRRVLSCIEANYLKSDFSLPFAAAQVELSPNYLSAVFSRETGTTFIEFVTRKRMIKARELLASGTMGSGTVAAAVGYRDCRYFSSLFKKTQGCTPREFRAKNGNI